LDPAIHTLSEYPYFITEKSNLNDVGISLFLTG